MNAPATNQSYEFILSNSLKYQHLQQQINSVDSLSQALKFKGNEDKMEHSSRNQFNTIQNSTRGYGR
jgi:hypothetical protein